MNSRAVTCSPSTINFELEDVSRMLAERGGAKWEGTDVRTVVAPHHDSKIKIASRTATLTEVATTKKRISYLDAVDFLARHNDVIGLDQDILEAFGPWGSSRSSSASTCRRLRAMSCVCVEKWSTRGTALYRATHGESKEAARQRSHGSPLRTSGAAGEFALVHGDLRYPSSTRSSSIRKCHVLAALNPLDVLIRCVVVV